MCHLGTGTGIFRFVDGDICPPIMNIYKNLFPRIENRRDKQNISYHPAFAGCVNCVVLGSFEFAGGLLYQHDAYRQKVGYHLTRFVAASPLQVYADRGECVK